MPNRCMGSLCFSTLVSCREESVAFGPQMTPGLTIGTALGLPHASQAKMRPGQTFVPAKQEGFVSSQEEAEGINDTTLGMAGLLTQRGSLE